MIAKLVVKKRLLHGHYRLSVCSVSDVENSHKKALKISSGLTFVSDDVKKAPPPYKHDEQGFHLLRSW